MGSLPWGLFLASSWTWCIGMFLPIIMLREYGWLGFLVFAVPNLIGCTIFGWVMPPERGRLLLQRAGWLTLTFSVVTVGYHLFFVGFAGRTLVAETARLGAPSALALSAMVLGAAAALSFLRPSLWPWLGSLAWCISILCWIGLALDGAAAGNGPTSGEAGSSALRGLADWSWSGTRSTQPMGDLASLAWPMVFGFLWSPWFDLSFHRARREAGSPTAFAVFGPTFALMLLFTAAYASEAGAFGTWVVVHLTVQATFTVAVHLRELRAHGLRSNAPLEETPPRSSRTDQPAATRWALVLAAWLGAAVLGAWLPSEANYLRILVFYGLFVPALGMLLLARPTPESNRRILPLLVLLGVACVIEELAFNHGRASLAWVPYAALWVLFMWQPHRWRNRGPRWRADPFRDGVLGPLGR